MVEATKTLEERYDKYGKVYYMRMDDSFLVWRYGTDNAVEIIDIEAHPTGQGYGTRLLKDLIDQFKDTPKKIIFGFTKSYNIKAQGFYKAVGFHLIKSMGEEMMFWRCQDDLSRSVNKIYEKNTSGK